MADITKMAAERGAELTRQLLAFARRQGLSPQSIDLNRQITGMRGLLSRTLSENIGINLILEPQLWLVLIDPSQLETAVLNLAINARDAMPNGGRLSIETCNILLDEEYADAHDEVTAGLYVMLSITDTGTGMGPETIKRAFEPFFTTKEFGRGSGLGLSMVYGFIKQSKGHVSIRSQIGAGTTIALYLPQSLEIEAEKPVRGLKQAKRGNELILLVEDDRLVSTSVSSSLQRLGYKVICAVDGQEALRILRANADIAMLFTDVVMPNGVDGHLLARRARELRPTLPILLASGYEEDKPNKNDRIRDGYRFLSKPWRQEDLADMVRRVLDGDRAGQL
jgi:CheY-like chemotaxis protein